MSLVVSIAHNLAVAQSKSVAIFGTDCGAGNIGLRLLAIDSNVSLPIIRIGRRRLDEESKQLFAMSMKRLGAARLSICDTALSVSVIWENLATLNKRGTTPDLVIVDGLQSLVPDMWDRKLNKAVIQELKAMAVEFGVPILVTTRVNRKLERRKCKFPALIDFPKGSIDESLDNALTLHRYEYYDPDTEFKDDARLTVLRSRHGPNYGTFLTFNAETCRFGNWVSKE